MNVAAALASARASLDAGRLEEAYAAASQVLARQPKNPDAGHIAGVVLMRAGQPAQALPYLKWAAEVRPKDASVQVDFAEVNLRLGKVAIALQHFRHAVSLDPECVPGLLGLAALSYANGDCEAAVEAGRRAVELRPGDREAIEVCSLALHFGGRADLALEVVRQGLSHHPHDAGLLQLLVFPTACAERDATKAFELHRELGGLIARQFPADPRPHTNTREPERRLRVGYFSRDYQSRWGPRFFGPIIEGNDRSRFDVVCYYASDSAEEVRRRPELPATTWTNTLGMDDAGFAARVRADKIDILVDMAGYTVGTRLPAFSMRAAPVQVTYLGYPNTTGLPAMDYRLVDWTTDPEGSESLATEELVRLRRCFLCPRFAPDAPPVVPPPCLARGYVTFGSFNTLSKIGPRVLSLWARILHEVPGSRILLKNVVLGQASVAARVRRDLEALGIEAGRVDLRGETPLESDHMRMYGEVEIALDPFPYNGTTTTFDALVMGVPVVTLLGDSHISRVGASMLGAAGMPELVASDEDEYAAIAARLASDPSLLAERRAAQRERIAGSALCDTRAFLEELESRFRAMWRRWCAAGPGAAGSVPS